MEMKYSYYKKVPNTDWIIASGYYESTIKNRVARQSIELYKSHDIKFRNLLIGSFILILISLTITYFVSKYIKERFLDYHEKITSNSQELKQLNETLEDKVHDRTKALETMTQKLEVLATVDSLTQVNNRYSIMKIMQVEINRANRNSTPLSVVMFDIDLFKNINDNYGHDIGDKVLSNLSNLVQSSLRSVDFLGRYGGEEFLIIMPNTSLDFAKQTSERLRITVESHDFDDVDKLTISLGLVELEKDEDIDQVFKRLDDLLYKSKESGRNILSC